VNSLIDFSFLELLDDVEIGLSYGSVFEFTKGGGIVAEIQQTDLPLVFSIKVRNEGLELVFIPSKMYKRIGYLA
jgi:hypothetical protein